MVNNAKEMKNSTFEEKYIIHGDKEREENLLHYSDPTPPQSQIPSFKISEESFGLSTPFSMSGTRRARTPRGRYSESRPGGS